MNLLFEAALEVGSFFSQRGWRYCIIGGLAVQRWGEPRTTLDADMTLLTGWGGEDPFIEAILAAFESRICDGHAFAREHRVLLLRASNGKDVDVALGALPFEEEMVRRALPVEFAPGVALPCCTAEDLFVMKAFADRPKDWLDAEGIAVRQSGLDRAYIVGQLATLCELKDDFTILRKAEGLLKEKP